MIQLLVVGTLVGIGFVLAIRSIGVQRFRTVWNPGLLLWQILRLLTIVVAAAALWLSGRFLLQTIAVVGVGFVIVYFWLEQPHEGLTQ